MSAATVILIVVGSHPQAERDDRPLAYRFQKQLESALAAEDSGGGRAARTQIVTDLWYLNDPALVAAPAIALGTIHTNAAVAHLASRLPQALVVDGEYEIQLDRVASDPRVVLSGVDAATTARAVQVFTEKFLAQWIEAIGQTHSR
ncbi:MAG: hypothetical protein EXS17_01660 [Phycisphaerales bacterium]|nr:hypothetical protein [Phycisphaerales bacterium]